MDRERLKENYLGCLLGSSVGDAFGAPYEKMSKDEIFAQYGEVKDFVRDADQHLWTDDTQMMMDVAESYVELKDCDVNDMAARFVKWFEKGGRGIGFTTSRVLWYISQGMIPMEASKTVWEEAKRELAGNGGLMRCAPTALARLNDVEKLQDESRKISLITHYDPRSTESCVLFNTILRDILLDSMKDYQQYLITITEPEVLKTAEEAPDVQIEDIPCGGYVIDTLRVAMWALNNCKSYEDALIRVLNLGGDTDTNCAVVGALFGAKYGLRGIPSRWLDKLDQKNRIENAALNLLEIFVTD